jgi:hypothetical protein
MTTEVLELIEVAEEDKTSHISSHKQEKRLRDEQRN